MHGKAKCLFKTNYFSNASSKGRFCLCHAVSASLTPDLTNGGMFLQEKRVMFHVLLHQDYRVVLRRSAGFVSYPRAKPLGDPQAVGSLLKNNRKGMQ